MKIEKSSKPSSKMKVLYNKNDFVTIYDRSRKDNFSIALIVEQIQSDQIEAKVMFFDRVNQFQNVFENIKEGNIRIDYILFDTQIVLNKKDMTVSLKSKYNTIVQRVDQEIKMRDLMEASEDIEEESKESSESIKQRKKKKEMKIQESGNDSESESSSSSQKSEDFSELFNSKRKKIGIKKIRSKSTKKQKETYVKYQGKIKKVKAADLRYKRGKQNPQVQFLEHSEQLNGKNNNPDFSCCFICNTRELIRSIQINNEKLFDNILNSDKKIIGLDVQYGPYSGFTPVKAIINQNNFRFLLKLIEASKTITNQQFAQNRSSINFVQTGQNDKFAYQVATRQVEMGRKNREGTNAFTYDVSYQNNIDFYQQLTKYIKDEEMIKQIILANPDSKQIFSQFVYKAVISGNTTLAGLILSIIGEGYGFTKFHYLALTANSKEELIELKKMNAKKKSLNQNKQITPTHCACINPNPEILQYYLDIGEETYIVDENQMKPIHYAAACESTLPLKLLLDKGIDCRDYDRFKNTPLMVAASAGRYQNIQLMCTHVQQNINIKNRNTMAAIHNAVVEGHLNCVDELIKFGANIHLEGKNKMSSLAFACQKGNFEIANFLLQKGAKILKTDKYRKSPLIHAIISGNLSLVSLLLTKGADFNGGDSSQNSPLHYACAYGFYEIIDILIQAGANINANNSWNLTPILIALMKNHYRCVQNLTKMNGIDINCRDNEGKTLLINNLIKFNERSLEFCNYLIKEKQADTNIVDLIGNNVLHYLAKICVDHESVKKRLGQVDSETHYNELQNQKNLYKRYFELLVIETNGNLNSKNFEGNSSLIEAIRLNNFNFIELCLQSDKVQLSEQYANNKSILHFCDSFLVHKRGYQLLKQLINKQNNLINVMKIFDDETGYNFFHQMLKTFVTSDLKMIVENHFNVKLNRLNQFLIDQDKNKITIEQQKFFQGNKDDESGIKLVPQIKKTNKFQNKIQQTAELDSQKELKQQLIQKKISEIPNKKVLMEQQLVQNFIDFIQFLKKNKYDFQIKVATIEKPYEQKKSEDEQQNQQQLFAQYNGVQYKFHDCFDDEEDSKWVSDKNNTTKFDYRIKSIINDDANSTILHILMYGPNTQIFNALFPLLQNYKPNTLNLFGESVLFYFVCSKSSNIQILNLLLDQGEDPNIPTLNKNYPILKVCRDFNTIILKRLIEININLNVCNENGESPLLFFSKQRKLNEVILILSVNNINVNIKDKEQRNALHWAINNNSNSDANIQIEENLLASGVDLNSKDIRGRTPINYFFVKIGQPNLSEKIDPIEILSDFLVYPQLNIHEQDEFGNTPLHYASQRGAYLCASAFIERGANINLKNLIGNTPLSIALLNGQSALAIMYLQMNADIKINVFEVNWKKLQKHQNKNINTNTNDDYNQQVKVRKCELEEFIKKEKDRILGENKKLRKIFEKKEKYSKMNNWQKQQYLNQNSDSEKSEIEEQGMIIETTDNQNLSNNEKQFMEKNFIERKLSLFQIALEKKADGVCYLLIEKGFDIGIATMESLFKKLFNYSSRLLSKKMDFDTLKNNLRFQTINPEGMNIYHVLAINIKFVDKQIFQSLFENIKNKDININSIDFKQNTPLIYAAKNKNLDLIQSMLQQGADPLYQDNCQNSIISCLIIENEVLKHNNIAVNQIIPLNKATVFVQPSRRFQTANLPFGNLQLQPLRSKSVRKKVQEEDEETVKQNIQSFIFSEIDYIDFFTNILSKYPALLNKKFIIRDESVPLKKSVNKSMSQIFNLKKEKEYSIIVYSAMKLKNMNLLQKFIQLGADLNIQDDRGFTLLTLAIRNNNKFLLNFLSQNSEQINFNILDKQGRSYLHHAVAPLKSASYENLELIQFIFSKVDYKIQDNEGRTALYYACMQSSGKVQKQLKQLGAIQEYQYDLKMMPTSKISNLPFNEIIYDFEEDYETQIQKLKNDEKIRIEKNKGLEVKLYIQQKPDKRISGKTLLVKIREPLVNEEFEFYDISLIKVDINYGQYSTNVFYLMQIVYDELRNIYILFTNWGRVGTDGQFQQTPFPNFDLVLKEFESIFKEKTGNTFSNRLNFIKMNKKYRLIKKQKKYISENILKHIQVFGNLVTSKLQNEIYNLMDNLTDSKFYQTVYNSFNINQRLLPLGSLSKDTLNQAILVLEEIKLKMNKLQNKEKKLSINDMYIVASEVCDLTSNYMELIPSIGNKEASIPAMNQHLLNNEQRKIKDLMYLEIIVKIMVASQIRIKEIHPFDYCFQSLDVKMGVLDRQSEEFIIIKKYIKCGQLYRKDLILNIYQFDRRGEKEIFENNPVKTNRRLLWHGTRTENLMGILQQGLRIAPQDASHTGAMFGNGVYFADLFDKSIQYSSDYQKAFDKPIYIILGEVALGNMKRAYQSFDYSNLKTEFNSVKGCGREVHNKDQRVYLNNGCMVPIGSMSTKIKEPRDKGEVYALNYNEYVVYNLSQVRLKYLVEINKQI